MPRHCLASAALMAVVLVSAALAAEHQWTPISTTDFSGWREGEHAGWSIVGDASLRADNDKRLDGQTGEGVLLSRGDSNLYTRDEFQDVELKIDFLVPAGSNSGVKLNGLYEIQIRDTAGKPLDELWGDDCGAIYPRAELGPPYKYLDRGVAPRVNSAKPAGEWQSLEIAFRSPRFDDKGEKAENARFVRVVLNGEVIHENVEVEYPTGAAWDEQPEVPRGPLMLQGDHGPVAFRNIQFRPIPKAATSGPRIQRIPSENAACQNVGGLPIVAARPHSRPVWFFKSCSDIEILGLKRNLAFFEFGHSTPGPGGVLYT